MPIEREVPRPADAPAAGSDEPIEITDALFKELTQDSAPTPGQQPTAPEAQPQLETEVGVDEPQAQPVTSSELAQMLDTIDRRIAASVQQGATPAAAKRDVVDRLAELYPGVERSALEMLVKTNDVLAEERLAPVLQSIGQQVQSLQEQVTQFSQQQTVGSFDRHLEGLLDQAKITDPWEREATRAVVVQKALQKYGPKLTLKDTTRVFVEANNQRLKTRGAARTAYTAAKDEVATSAAPAAATPTGSRTGAPDLMRHLTEDRSHAWGFKGGKFNDAVRQFIQRTKGLAG